MTLTLQAKPSSSPESDIALNDRLGASHHTQRKHHHKL